MTLLLIILAMIASIILIGFVFLFVTCYIYGKAIERYYEETHEEL